MSSGETTQHEALIRLGASTAESVAQTLEMFAPGEVTRGDVSVIDAANGPFGSVEPGTVAAGVSYVDGVTGANVFLAPRASARALALKMGVPPEGEPDDDLTELELSAVSEASNQMMAAAAAAISVVLGQEVEISPPTTRVIAGAQEADELFGSAPYATATTFLIGGEACRLVQLVPNAFVLRVTHALDQLDESEPARSPETASAGAGDGLGSQDGSQEPAVALSEAIGSIRMRVWAEVGRTCLPLGETLALPLGAVVELDRSTEAPVDLYVNGLRFAHGHLLVDDEGRWAFELTELSNLYFSKRCRIGLQSLTFF